MLILDGICLVFEEIRFFFLKKVLYFLMTSSGGFQNPSCLYCVKNYYLSCRQATHRNVSPGRLSSVLEDKRRGPSCPWDSCRLLSKADCTVTWKQQEFTMSCRS